MTSRAARRASVRLTSSVPFFLLLSSFFPQLIPHAGPMRRSRGGLQADQTKKCAKFAAAEIDGFIARQDPIGLQAGLCQYRSATAGIPGYGQMARAGVSKQILQCAEVTRLSAMGAYGYADRKAVPDST